MSEIDIDAKLRDHIRELARSSYKTVELPDDLEILESDLRFDSIAYAELLLACEEDFGVPFDDSWAERKQLTIGELAKFIRQEMK
jgi:acyl carrier protein